MGPGFSFSEMGSSTVMPRLVLRLGSSNPPSLPFPVAGAIGTPSATTPAVCCWGPTPRPHAGGALHSTLSHTPALVSREEHKPEVCYLQKPLEPALPLGKAGPFPKSHARNCWKGISASELQKCFPEIPAPHSEGASTSSCQPTSSKHARAFRTTDMLGAVVRACNPSGSRG